MATVGGIKLTDWGIGGAALLAGHYMRDSFESPWPTRLLFTAGVGYLAYRHLLPTENLMPQLQAFEREVMGAVARGDLENRRRDFETRYMAFQPKVNFQEGVDILTRIFPILKAPQAKNPLKVVSYNVLADCTIRARGDRQFGNAKHLYPASFNKDQRLPRIVQTLLGQDADVICLQEVEPDAFKTIQNGLGTNYVAYFQTNKDGRYGQAIFIRDKTTSPLQNRVECLAMKADTDDVSGRVALVANLRIPTLGKTVRAACVHLDFKKGVDHLTALVRNFQAEDARSPNDGTMFVGDFNASAGSPVLNALLRQGYQLDPSIVATVGKPWVANYGMHAIDHVVHSGTMRSQTSTVCSQDYLANNQLPDQLEGSDHSAIVSLVTFAEAPAAARQHASPAAVSRESLLAARAARDGFIPFYGARESHDPLTYFLGNFSLIPVTINFGDGIGSHNFRCAEAAFQAAKFAHNPKNKALIAQFASLSGEQALAHARENKGLEDPTWKDERVYLNERNIP